MIQVYTAGQYRPNSLQHAVHSLNLSIPLRVEGAGVRLGKARQLRQLMEEIVLKFSSLVTVHRSWKSKLKIIENLFSHRSTSCYLVLRWVGQCKPCEVTYYEQNILKSSWGFLQMGKVYGHHLKRGSCHGALHWCFKRDLRHLLLDAATFCWQ